MAIFHFFKKAPVLFRCTHCYYEYDLLPKYVRYFVKLNRTDPVCPAKHPCHICHIGFMIPVKYIDKHGKQYLFHEIKPKIKNLDPDTVLERILDATDSENISFFGPFD